jgi:hypothetical protein
MPEFTLDVFNGFVHPVANAGMIIDRQHHVDAIVRCAEPGKGAMDGGHGAVPIPLDYRGGPIHLVGQSGPVDFIYHIRHRLGERIAGTYREQREIEKHVGLLIERRSDIGSRRSVREPRVNLRPGLYCRRKGNPDFLSVLRRPS